MKSAKNPSLNEVNKSTYQQVNKNTLQENEGSLWAKHIKWPHNTSNSYEKEANNAHTYRQGNDDIKMSNKGQAIRI